MQTEDTKWKICGKTSEAWKDMLAALRSATVSIDVENFIVSDFCDGEIGCQLLEVLKNKAREQVRVRILVDAIGSLDFITNEKQSELEAVGIEVKIFKILPTRKINNIIGLFLRDHRKLIIIDGREAFIGGVCFQDSQATWRDVNISITGGVMPSLTTTFENIFSAPEKLELERFEWTADGFAVLPSAPRNRQIYREILTAVRKAKMSIIIMTPYFAPPAKLLIALLRARRRGVSITFLFSKATDNSVGDLVLRSYLSMFLKRSCQVFFCTDAVNHGKVVLVDEKWVTVGSANFDRLSLLYNNELNIVSTNDKFLAAIGEMLSKVKAVSAELSLKEWKNRSFKQKVLEILVRPLRLIA